MEIRELLEKYGFDHENTPVIAGSALCALNVCLVVSKLGRVCMKYHFRSVRLCCCCASIASFLHVGADTPLNISHVALRRTLSQRLALIRSRSSWTLLTHGFHSHSATLTSHSSCQLRTRSRFPVVVPLSRERYVTQQLNQKVR